MTVIERKYGIPRSTLSGWFKYIELSETQRIKLMRNSEDGWKKARINANKWHRAQKAARLETAQQQASDIVDRLTLTDDVLDLAFAMLYFGEGAKTNGTTSIANSDPIVLNFVLNVLDRNYKITREMVRCDLHLRADQDPNKLKLYWSEVLGIPIDRFRGCYIDKRTLNKPTYESYKGVCLLYCGSVAIQRKLTNLYNLFCTKVAASK